MYVMCASRGSMLQISFDLQLFDEIEVLQKKISRRPSKRLLKSTRRRILPLNQRIDQLLGNTGVFLTMKMMKTVFCAHVRKYDGSLNLNCEVVIKIIWNNSRFCLEQCTTLARSNGQSLLSSCWLWARCDSPRQKVEPAEFFCRSQKYNYQIWLQQRGQRKL